MEDFFVYTLTRRNTVVVFIEKKRKCWGDFFKWIKTSQKQGACEHFKQFLHSLSHLSWCFCFLLQLSAHCGHGSSCCRGDRVYGLEKKKTSLTSHKMFRAEFYWKQNSWLPCLHPDRAMLQPATRGWSRCFGFAFRELSYRIITRTAVAH